MKPKNRKICEAEYEALIEKLDESRPKVAGNGTTFVMLTGDFEVTQNVNDARWLMTESPLDQLVYQIDGIGDAILLLPQ